MCLIRVIDLGVYSSLRLILNPFSNKELVLRMIEITALTFAHIADPVTFEVIAVTLGQYTITIALAFVPLAFVNVLISVDHTALALRKSIDPVAIVTIAILVEEGASSVLLVFVPVSCVFTSQLRSLILPVGTLTMALIHCPHTFVFISVCVELNTEALLAVIAPVADVFLTGLPLLALDRAVLGLVLLLDPVYGAMRTIFLSLGIITLYRQQNKTVKINQAQSPAG